MKRFGIITGKQKYVLIYGLDPKTIRPFLLRLLSTGHRQQTTNQEEDMSTAMQTVSARGATTAAARTDTERTSPKRLARIAGILYFFVGIFGGFAEGFVDPKLHNAGNAAATAATVVANEGLVRMAVIAHFLDGTFFIFLALALYILLKHVHKSAARAFVVLVALATGIICLNAVFEFEGLRVATDSSYAAAFGTGGSNALVQLLIDTQHYGTLAAQVFFGLWLVPLGYVAYKSSGMFPKWLGVLLIAGGVCYLVDLLAAFLVPDLGQKIASFILIPSAVAEISMVFYLLIIGVKSSTTDQRNVAAA